MIRGRLFIRNWSSIMQNSPQLFCFTFAGGTKEFFDEIERDLIGLDVVKLEYAGHGERHKEEFYQDFDALADDMFQKVKNRICGEYALFGYSMGSITAVEVLKRIVETDINLPKHIFIAAHEPHTKSELLGYAEDEVDEWVKERTIEFGAVPEKLINNKVFWRTYLPIYRADYTIIGKYKFEELNLKLDVPTTVFYSETDTSLKDMQEWNRFFPCEFYHFEGTHFFIQKHHEEMAGVIEAKMGVQDDI